MVLVLQAAGVILAIKRYRNKVINLYEYYDELEDYLLKHFPEDFPDNLPDYILDDLPEDFLESISFLDNLTSAEVEALDKPQLPENEDSPFNLLADLSPYIFPNGVPHAVGYLRPGIFPKVKFPGREESGEFREGPPPLFRRTGQAPRHLPAPPLPSGQLEPPSNPHDVQPSLPQVYHPQHSSTYQKRSLPEPPPSGDFHAAVAGLLATDDVHEVVLKTAQLVQDVVHHLDEDDCLLKFLCYIHEQPQETRAPEQDLLVRLYHLNATAEALECGRDFTNCHVPTAKLAEAFSYSWPSQNTA